jgi:hypothetical protein
MPRLGISAVQPSGRLSSPIGSVSPSGDVSSGMMDTGDQLSVDHIVPRAVVPELDNVIANLEFMPERLNSKKQDKIGARQADTARKLNKAGLLSDRGLKAIQGSR